MRAAFYACWSAESRVTRITLGGGNPRANHEIAQRLTAACGRSMVNACAACNGSPAARIVGTRSIPPKRTALGWAPRTPFDTGLHDTIAWYRANETWWRPLGRGLALA